MRRFCAALGCCAGPIPGHKSGDASPHSKAPSAHSVNSTYFLDAGTFLPVKIMAKVSMMGQEVEGETYSGNYKKVDGILFAHSMEAYVNGQTLRMDYDKIEVNVPMDDSLFRLPGTETPVIKK